MSAAPKTAALPGALIWRANRRPPAEARISRCSNPIPSSITFPCKTPYESRFISWLIAEIS
jgi:hypothetical protein